MTTQTFNRFGVKACYPCKPCPPPQFECENCDTCRPVVGVMTLNDPDCVFFPGAATPPVEARCTPYPPPGSGITTPRVCEYYSHFYDDNAFGPAICNMYSDGATEGITSGIDDTQSPLGTGRYEADLPRWPTCNGNVDGNVLSAVGDARCQQITIDLDLSSACPTMPCETGSLDMNNITALNAAGLGIYSFNTLGIISMTKVGGNPAVAELSSAASLTNNASQIASVEDGELVLRVVFLDRVGNPGQLWGFAWHAWSAAFNGCGAYTLSPDAARSSGEIGGAVLPVDDIFLELFP